MKNLETTAQIFEMIEPADPDKIIRLKQGGFRALWSTAAAPKDIAADRETMRNIQTISITNEVPDISDLPGWNALDFMIKT